MRYRHGEIVDILIKGARVLHCDGGSLVYEYSEGARTDREEVQYEFGAVEITRIAPAEWPPQPDDLWRDSNGALWFAARHYPDYDDHADARGINNNGWRTVLVPSALGNAGEPARPEDVVQSHGPFTLVRREEDA